MNKVFGWSRKTHVPGVQLVERVVVVALLEEGNIRGLGEVALVVQEVQDADGFARQQLNHRLVVLEKSKTTFDYFTSRSIVLRKNTIYCIVDCITGKLLLHKQKAKFGLQKM